MTKSAGLPAAIAIAVLASACGVTSTVDQYAFDNDTPRTVAVLPFYSDSTDPHELERVDYTRRIFYEQLTPLPFAILSLEATDARLRRQRLLERRKNRDWKAADLAFLDVDAVVVAEIDDYSATNVALFSREGINGRFRALAVPSGEVLWEAENSYRSYSGLVLQSGQAVDAIRRLVNSSDEVYIAAVDQFIADVVATIPATVQEKHREVQLELTGFRIEPTREGPLRVGDRIDFAVEGTPDMFAYATCGPALRIPMVEASPGVYVGSHIIVRGEEFRTRTFGVALSSPFGTSRMERIESENEVVVDTRPPALLRVEHNTTANRVSFVLGDPNDAVKFVVEANGEPVQSAGDAEFALAQPLPATGAQGYVLDARGNQSKAAPIVSSSRGGE